MHRSLRQTPRIATVATLAVLLASVSASASPSMEVPEAAPSTRTFLEMFVAGVVPSGERHTLVLVSPAEEVLLPLGIGLPEAIMIHGRLERKETARPMTHDLLEHIVARLGGEVVRVQIDDLRDDVFVSTVVIRTGGKLVSFDARPSDAVAIALGNRTPILVSRRVVDRAALQPEDLEKAPSTPPPPAPAVLSL